MAEFRYTINGESATIVVDEERDLARLAAEVKRTIEASLQEKGMTVEQHDMQYMQSRIAIAITRDLISKEFIDLGEIKVTRM